MRTWLLGIWMSAAALGQTGPEALLHPEKNAANWVHYSFDYAGTRHSPLRELTAENAGKLDLKWAFTLRMREKFETTPLVVDGVMYITAPPNDAYALDAETGVKLWEYHRNLPPKINVCCGQVNRGFAVAGDKLFLATLDAHLVALDRKNGRVLWDVAMVDYRLGYSATHAPLVVKDKVIVGVAGGEYGIRGFLDAYGVEDGKRRWRFYTVPGPGEYGNETWAGDSWRRGGAPIWITGSYDPELNLTYWGTGNPGPDWNGEVRKGDNLFSDSVIALDADTGERKWHFQFTPHDVHDWDATQIMVLRDGVVNGRQRKLLLSANRNGFYYVLDRATGEFLNAKTYVKQTWAKELDAKGRPVRNAGIDPTEEGVRVYPMVTGGTNWNSPALNPDLNLFYVAVREGSSVYYSGEATYREGARYQGSFFRNEDVMEDWYGAIRALQPETGELKWEHKLFRAPWSGLLSTAGNLVFTGTDDGYFLALDGRNGKEVWRRNIGGQVIAGPMTYSTKSGQKVAIAAGTALFVFGK